MDSNQLKVTYNLDGTIADYSTDAIYGLSNSTVVITIIAPFESSETIEVSFGLANGVNTERFAATLTCSACEEVNGDLYNRWEYTLGGSILSAISKRGSSNNSFTVWRNETTVTSDDGYNWVGQYSTGTVLNDNVTGAEFDYAGVGTSSTRGQLQAWEYNTNSNQFEDTGLDIDDFESTNGIDWRRQVKGTNQFQFTVNTVDVADGQEAYDLSATDILNDRIAQLEADVDALQNEQNEPNLKVYEDLGRYPTSTAQGFDSLLYVQDENGNPSRVTGRQFLQLSTGVDKGSFFDVDALLSQFPNGPRDKDGNIIDKGTLWLGFVAGVRTSSTGQTEEAGDPNSPYVTEVDLTQNIEDPGTDRTNGQVRFDTDGLKWVDSLTTYAPDNSTLQDEIDNLEQRVDNIEDGTTVVTRAEQDQLGNVIDTTYETKADANTKESNLQSQIDTNTGNIATNTNAIAGGTNIGPRITANETNIATNASNISANDNDITDLQNNKEDLSNKSNTVDFTTPSTTEYLTESAVVSIGSTVKEAGVQIGSEREYTILNFGSGATVTPSGSIAGQINIDVFGSAGDAIKPTTKDEIDPADTPLTVNIAPQKVNLVEINAPTKAAFSKDGNGDLVIEEIDDSGFTFDLEVYTVNTDGGSNEDLIVDILIDGVIADTRTTELAEVDGGDDHPLRYPVNFQLNPLDNPTLSVGSTITYEVSATSNGDIELREFFVLTKSNFLIGNPVEDVMFKSTYDTDNSGVVDDAERLGGELPSFYATESDLTTAENRITQNETDIATETTRNDTQDTSISTNKLEIEDRLTVGNFKDESIQGVIPFRRSLGMWIADNNGNRLNTPMLEDGFIPIIELIKSSDQTVTQGNTAVITFETEDTSNQDPDNLQYQKSGNGVEELSTNNQSDYFAKFVIKLNNVNVASMTDIGQFRLLQNGTPIGPFISIPPSTVDGTFILEDEAPDISVSQNDVFTAELEVFEDLDAPTLSVTILATNGIGEPLTVFGAFKNIDELYTYKIKEQFLGQTESTIEVQDIYKTRTTANDNEIQDKSTAITDILGQTIEQLLNNSDNFATWSTQDFTTININGTQYQSYNFDGSTINGDSTNVLNDNTQYTLLSSIQNNTMVSGSGYFLNGSELGTTSVEVSASDTGETGIKKQLFTTGTVTTGLVKFFMSSSITSGGIDVRHAILEGDYTSLSDEEALQIIENVDFGFASVGEKVTTQELDNDYSTWTTQEFTVEETDGVEYQVYTGVNGDAQLGITDAIEANNQYTLITEVLKNTTTEDDTLFITGAAGGWTETIFLEKGFLGIDKTLTTSDGTTHRCGLSTGANNGDIVKMRQIILLGDYTTLSDKQAQVLVRTLDTGVYDLSSIDIKSIGKNQINLIDYVEETNNNVSGTYSLDGRVLETLISSNATTSHGILDLVPNTSYTFNADFVEGTTTFRIQVATLDGASVYDSGNVSSAVDFTTNDNSKYHVKIISASSPFKLTNIQLEKGTTATTYESYRESNTTIPYKLRSAGTVQDEIKDGVLIQRVDEDFNDVVQNATGWTISRVKTNTHAFEKDLKSILGYVTQPDSASLGNLKLKIGNTIYLNVGYTGIINDDIEFQVSIGSDGTSSADRLSINVNKTTYPNSASFEAYLQANDVQFIYELDEYNTIDIDDADLNYVAYNNGQEQINSGNVQPDITTEYALNVSTQLAKVTEATDNNKDNITDINQNLVLVDNRLDNLEATQSTNQSDIDANTTHRDSDGKDHSDVVLNNTHRTSDGTDHSNVVTNTSNISTNTSNISTNTSNIASNTVGLAQTAQYILLEDFATGLNITSATSTGAATLISNTGPENYEAIVLAVGGVGGYREIITINPPEFSSGGSGSVQCYTSTASSSHLIYTAQFFGTTDLRGKNAKLTDLDETGISVNANTDIYVWKVWGVMYPS